MCKHNNLAVIEDLYENSRRKKNYKGFYQIILKRFIDIVLCIINVHFLGYRNDVKELYEMSDCFVMPFFREGLSRSIMEAMASGLPCIVSDIRGNRDLIDDKKGGYLGRVSKLKRLKEIE